MTIYDFEKFIEPKILERGEDYYISGNVINIERLSPEKWSAKVEGTEIYNVEIILRDDIITESYCDCPYDMGDICKHQSACFFELRDLFDGNNTENNGKNKKISRSEELDKLLEKTDMEKLKNFIKESALKDDKIYASLISEFGLNDEIIDKSIYTEIINNHLNAARDRHGFIDYYRANQAMDGAFTVLGNADAAVENENYNLAVAMAQCVIETVIPSIQYTDDSGGSTGTAINDGFRILYECSAMDLNESLRKNFFEYCLKEHIKDKYHGWPDWQLDFIRIAGNLAKKENELDLIISIIDEYEKGESNYLYRELLLLKYNILIKTGKIKEAKDFFQSCLHIPQFRKISIDKAINENDYGKAEKLALEGESVNKEWPGIVDDWKKYRLKIYDDTGQIEKKRVILKEFVFEMKFDSYLSLKSTYDQTEWNNIYREITGKLKEKTPNYASTFLMRIYKEENLLKELLDEIKKEPSHISEYDDFLVTIYPDDVYALYKTNLIDKAKYSDKRSRYKELCGIIRRLLKIGGKATALEIINHFKSEYKYKRAFMDEISKIKI